VNDLVLEKKFLICIAGLPASGKTTFSKALKKVIEERFPIIRVKIIDPDIIRQEIMGNTFQPKKEEIVRKANLTQISNAIQKDYAVISDDLNYYASMRHDLKDISEKFQVAFFIVHIATPLEICIEWNELRGKPIPNKLIKEIHKKFDYFNKYAWDEPDAVYDLSEHSNIKLVAQDFLKHLENAFISRFRDKTSKKESTIERSRYHHTLDRITREVVGEFLQQKTYREIKKKILKNRKKFIKRYIDSQMDEKEIRNKFKMYIKEKLNI
jgi:tRNA uridine 5-carbamoylmethylation protein Kti12